MNTIYANGVTFQCYSSYIICLYAIWIPFAFKVLFSLKYLPASFVMQWMALVSQKSQTSPHYQHLPEQ